jgi:hypothetical protein
MNFSESGPCSLCGKLYYHWGHNPEPLKPFEERCCRDCNATKVIPARLASLRCQRVAPARSPSRQNAKVIRFDPDWKPKSTKG